MRVEDAALLPIRAYPARVVLFPRESVVAALDRIRGRDEDEFPVARAGVVLGTVRRRDLLALAASDRVTHDLD